MIWGKIIASNTYITKEERSKSNHLNFQLKKLEKEEQIKFKVSRGKDINTSRAEVNEEKKSIKRQRLLKWIKKQDLHIYCLQKTHFKNTYRLKVNGSRKKCHANSD